MMIAMALMCGPQLLLADEPTTALDVTIQAELLRVLRHLQEEFGMGMILITHDLGVVSRMADKVAVMYAGQIVEHGDVHQVFKRPSHPYTRGLLECVPIPGRHQHMTHLPSIPGVVPSLIGDLTGCAFRQRCQYAEDRCGQTDIKWRQLPNGQGYRCVQPANLHGIVSEVSQ
jgi:peptide/nickel transport system ATP-binding protein